MTMLHVGGTLLLLTPRKSVDCCPFGWFSAKRGDNLASKDAYLESIIIGVVSFISRRTSGTSDNCSGHNLMLQLSAVKILGLV